jgi:hypothetical protein
MEEFVFPSHTSVISRELLVDELHKQGIDASSGGNKKKVSKSGEEIVKSSIEKRAENLLKRRNLRAVVLEKKFDTGLPEGEKPLKRVQLEALDFDWIFDGNNA